MKNFKKALTILLCMVLVFSMVGCSKSDDQTGTSSSNGTSTSGGSSSELTYVKMCFPSLLFTPSAEGAKQTEDAMNNYLESKGDNIRIKLEAMDATNYVTDMNLKLTGKSESDEVDIFCPLTGVAPAVAQEQIVPLTDYINTDLSGISSILGDYLKAGYVGEDLYGIPCWKEYGLSCYYFYRSDIAEELGFTEDKIKTLDDVEKLLKAVKEKYPEMYGFVPTGGSANAGNTLMLETILAGPKHYMVDTLTSGVGIIGDSTTVVNTYDTPFFKEVCETAYRLNQEGLVMPDASITSELGRDLIQAGRAFSVVTGYGSTGQYDDMGEFYTKELGHPIKAAVLDTFLVSSSNCMPQWSVSYKCKNVGAACKLLNYFYTDEFMINTLLNGVENVHYIKNADGSISFPDGVDAASSSYYAFISCGIVGSMSIQWPWDTAAKPGKTIEQANAESSISKAFGFAVRNDDFADEASAISNVENQYLYGLICGELNPDEYLPKFNQALKNAGIDTVIENVQAQLNDFLSK